MRVCLEMGDLAPKLQEAGDRLTRVFIEKEEAVRAAKHEFAILDARRLRIGELAEAERRTIARELEQTCPPEIDALIREIEATIDGMNLSRVFEKKTQTEEIERRAKDLLRARQAAYSLRSRYVPDLPAELQAIRDTFDRQ